MARFELEGMKEASYVNMESEEKEAWVRGLSKPLSPGQRALGEASVEGAARNESSLGSRHSREEGR